MKRKFNFLFLSALTIPFFMGSCSDDKEEQEVKPATDLVVDNNSVTLLQGDEITVSITSGNGDYYVKPFDESVATATINGNKVTIKATENSQLEENNRTETTILIVDGRKKVARVLVRVAKLWNLTVDAPEEGFDLFILARLTDDNKTYLKTAELITEDGATKLKLTGKKLGTTTLELSDAAGQKLTLPVYVNPVCYRMEYDVCFKIDIKKYAESHSEVKSMNQLTFEVVFYPTYTRSMQSFIGLESVFLLRAEAKDVNPRFEIATKINGKSDPRFRSQQTIYCDDSEGGRKTPGKWYHIAIVYDGTKSSTKEAYKMYINGVRETLTPADNSYEDCAPNSSLNLTDVGGNDKALLIGRSGDSYRVGYCKVYQARMWKRALDESEIKANMCKILNAEEHSDLMGYWVFSKGVGGTTVFENWGNGGSGLDAQVCLQNISENKPAWGAELPATYNGDKSRFEPIECPHSY